MRRGRGQPWRREPTGGRPAGRSRRPLLRPWSGPDQEAIGSATGRRSTSCQPTGGAVRAAGGAHRSWVIGWPWAVSGSNQTVATWYPYDRVTAAGSAQAGRAQRRRMGGEGTEVAGPTGGCSEVARPASTAARSGGLPPRLGAMPPEGPPPPPPPPPPRPSGQ